MTARFWRVGKKRTAAAVAALGVIATVLTQLDKIIAIVDNYIHPQFSADIGLLKDANLPVRVAALKRLAGARNATKSGVCLAITALVKEKSPAANIEKRPSQLPPDIQESINSLSELIKREQCSKIDLSQTDLTRLQLSGGSLFGTNLTGTWLEGAVLQNADLNNADLTGALLREAHLENAKLHQAVFAAAELLNANFTGSQGGCFAGALHPETAHLDNRTEDTPPC